MNKLDKSKNARRNIIYGVINKIVTLLFPFLCQTVLIRTLGAEYNGLKGLFSSILSILSLAELGVGAALVFSMYKPIADGDKVTICALLNLYKKLYQYIGTIIFVVGILLVPFLPHLISGECPKEINLTVLYALYLFNTVISYLMYAYKTSLFLAFQRVDIINIIATFISFLLNIGQMLVLILLKNYYAFMLVAIFSSILNNLIISYCSDQMYPEYKCVGEIDHKLKAEIKEKIKGLVLYKLCGATRNSFDNIFISIYLGLVLTGIYNNYFYILSSVSGIFAILTGSITAGIGNSIVSESVDKNYQDMRKINFLYMLISGWASVCMLCLYQPFMKVWVGDKLMLPFGVVILLTLYFYILKMGDVRATYADAKGLWWENRYRTILEAAINIVLNYIFVRKWGIYGIVAATIITLFVFGFIGASSILFRYYFRKGLRLFFKDHTIYFIVTSVVGGVTYNICNFYHGNSVSVLIVRALICCTVSPVLYYFAYFNTNIFKESIPWIKMRVRN